MECATSFSVTFIKVLSVFLFFELVEHPVIVVKIIVIQMMKSPNIAHHSLRHVQNYHVYQFSSSCFFLKKMYIEKIFTKLPKAN